MRGGLRHVAVRSWSAVRRGMRPQRTRSASLSSPAAVRSEQLRLAGRAASSVAELWPAAQHDCRHVWADAQGEGVENRGGVAQHSSCSSRARVVAL